MSKFFIDRPIFASVISLIILLAGSICIFNLPIAQYPELTPPTVEVAAKYPGASAEVISDTVSAPLEQKINGVEDMIYMNSISSNNGDSVTRIFFKVGTDPDKAMINVNNRVQMAMSSIPEDVRRYGVTVDKKSSTILQMMVLYSTTSKYDSTYLGNYALVNMIDELKRIPGVGDAIVLGSNDYSICIWLLPDKMAKMKISPSQVAAAIRAQNSQRAAGKIGQEPSILKVDKSYTIIAHGRYSDPEQFKEIIIRTTPDGRVLRLKDIANVELGSQSYELTAMTKGNVAVPIMIALAPGANALSVASAVEKKVEELSRYYPEGIKSKITYETAGFVRNSIKEVVKTLFEAIFLVFLVIFIFLKDWRATLIPCLAVPVSIVGAFAGMMLLNFSINTLTLFGLVLAIGIVVDDAIVVIENVERIMRTDNLHVREATIKAMEEVTGPVVAIVLVLCSVFLPVSFMGGLVGVMYKQFAITITISVVISGLVALTLTPALCVVLLGDLHDVKSNVFLDKFENFFVSLTSKYVSIVEFCLNKKVISTVILFCMLSLTTILLKTTPKSMLPNEDQGVLFYCAMLDPATSLKRSSDVMNYLDNIVSNDKSVSDMMNIVGYNLLSSTQNNSSVSGFVKLKPWDERTTPDSSVGAIVKKVLASGFGVLDGLVLAFSPPPIVGMSMTGGFEGYIQRNGDTNSKELEKKVKEFVALASKRPELKNVTTTFSANTPQFKMVVNELKASYLGVPIDELYFTIQSTFGKSYINDFTKYGRSFKVMMQSRGDFRAYPEQINTIYVMSSSGNMVPLSEFVELIPTVGPDLVERFNCFSAAKILGEPAAGYTSGEAIAAVEEVCSEILGDSYSLAWTGSAYQEKEAGGSTSAILLLGLVVVFLILAAQYEKWSLPFSVIAAVPFAVFGAILAVYLRNFSNDLYFQIALLTLVGLSAKNAILIVEFAVILRKRGESLKDSALKAAKLRFRPIIMTSLAFILGCVPLAFSSGAGCASRHSIGTGIIGGMLGVTTIAPFFIPLFYVVITSFSERFFNKKLKEPNVERVD